MKIGLFVEGPSDKVAFEKLVRKIRKDVGVVTRVIPRGEMFSAENMRVYVQRLLSQHSDLAKIIVCVDSECSAPDEIRKHTEQVHRQLGKYGYSGIIQYVVVIHALEGWLGADKNAVKRVLGSKSKRDICQNLENICQPAKVLEELFKRHGKSFQKTRHNPLLAQYVNPKTMTRNSASFSLFCQQIRDP